MRPVSGFTKSFEKNKDSYDRDEMTDESRAKKQRLDALTEKLGCTSYYHKMRWSWLFQEMGGLRRPLDVDRYYQEKKIAIDFGVVPELYYKTKVKLFNDNGIKYFTLENAHDLKSLSMELS